MQQAKPSLRIKMRIRKGDTVQVINGKDKGKTGEILEINRKLNKVKIKSINMIKKHLKPSKENTDYVTVSEKVARVAGSQPFVESNCKT